MFRSWGPALILAWLAGLTIPSPVSESDVLRLGADRLLAPEFAAWIDNRRVGLITNQTGVDSELTSTTELLERRPSARLTALFAPEHGLFGQAQAGVKIASERNVFSLYGETRAPTPEMLSHVDVLVFDIQDVGVRFYTYISTLFECMKAAAQQGIPLIVLDRPNPINGLTVEGPMLEAGFESFIGIYRLPVRHGMTVGEVARYFNAEASLGCDLRVIPMAGWKRDYWFDQTGQQWVLPSPNMPALSTATVYPGSCLIEATNLSEGRGTTRPFELIGAPWLNHQELAARLNRLQLEGVHFRPQSFTPSFSKYQGEACFGVQIHVLDRRRFQPVTTILRLISEVAKLHPDKFEIRAAGFDQRIGNSWVRTGLLSGRPVQELEAQWQADLQAFRDKRRRYLLY